MSMTFAPGSEPHPRLQDCLPYRNKVWRVVEAQHRISTNRLAAAPADQTLLEELVEEVKPALPREARDLPYLLATPFRYGYSRASRFRRASERPGIFYAAEHIATSLAESAWWRLFFLARSPGAATPRNTIEHTAFSVTIDAAAALDLTAPPLNAGAELWMSPHDYSACQRFASAARVIGAQLIRYASVRDASHRANIALLDPAAFVTASFRIEQTWHFRIERGRQTALAAFPSKEFYSFTAAQFGL